MRNLSRRAALGAMGVASVTMLVACAGGSGSQGGASSSDPAASGDKASDAQATAHLAIGTLATEDMLPFWLAEERGMFAEKGLQVDIVTFQSATELIAGLGSGDVQLAMTDIMVAASMFAGGTDLQLLWVTLGTEADQGRFGIMVNSESDIKDLSELAGVPVGVGSNTILEYVLDKLMEQAGVPQDQVVVEELQKLPVRYQAMLAGEVAAAALPGSLLALGEANGCRVVADDTSGENLSQSVMVARADTISGQDWPEVLASLESIWDAAAELVDEAPADFRPLLADTANLSSEIEESYPVSEYPSCVLPSAAMVEPVLEWMTAKGYLAKPLSYDEATGKFTVQ